MATGGLQIKGRQARKWGRIHQSSARTPPGDAPGVGRWGFEGEIPKTDVDSPRSV
jgi:hypothetical protein